MYLPSIVYNERLEFFTREQCRECGPCSRSPSGIPRVCRSEAIIPSALGPAAREKWPEETIADRACQDLEGDHVVVGRANVTEKNRGSTHDPSEGEDAEGDLGNVPALEEVGRLEDLLVRNAVLPDRRLEPGEEQTDWVGLGTASDFE